MWVNSNNFWRELVGYLVTPLPCNLAEGFGFKFRLCIIFHSFTKVFTENFKPYSLYALIVKNLCIRDVTNDNSISKRKAGE